VANKLLHIQQLHAPFCSEPSGAESSPMPAAGGMVHVSRLQCKQASGQPVSSALYSFLRVTTTNKHWRRDVTVMMQPVAMTTVTEVV